MSRAFSKLIKAFNLNLTKIGSGEVENELKLLKSNKATGWDGISLEILQLTARSPAPSLTSLYKTVIGKGNWPNTWKMGHGPLLSRKDIKPTGKLLTYNGTELY